MKTIAQMAIDHIDAELAQLNAVQPLTEDQCWDRRYDAPITDEGEPISHEEWESEPAEGPLYPDQYGAGFDAYN